MVDAPTRAQRLERLRTCPLPFGNTAVGSAWERRSVDVRAVHGAALERVGRLIARGGGTALVVGQAGAGKTHLLGTLCHALSAEAGRYLFAEVRPVIDARRPLTQLAREVVANLLQRPPGEARVTQLAALPARLVAAYLRVVGARTPGLAEVAQALDRDPGSLSATVTPRRAAWLNGQVAAWIAATRPSTWRPALDALLAHAWPAHRADSATWLRGEWPDDALDPEDRAARLLRTLGAALPERRALLCCFDQVENLDTPERRAAFATQVEFLVREVPGAVVLCAARGDRWPALAAALPPALAAAFEAERVELAGCAEPEARALVDSRLAAAAEPDWPAGFPFDTPEARARLDALVREGTTPRVVLQRANRLWLEVVQGAADLAAPAPEQPVEVVARWVAARALDIRARPERHEGDRDGLVAALKLALQLRVGTAFIPPAGAFERASLVARVPDGVAALFVDGDTDGRAVAANLRHALALLETGEARAVAYVRERRLAYQKRWVKAMEYRAALVAAGALCLDLDVAALSGWLALHQLWQALYAGDITYQTGTGQTAPVPPGELARYLAEAPMEPTLASVLELISAPRVRA